MVNIILEGRRGIIEAKGQYKGFKEAKAYNKSCFLLIAFGNTEFIKSSNNIKLCVDLSIIESV